MKKGQKMPEELRKRRSEYMKTHPLNYWLGKKRGSPNIEWRKNVGIGLKRAYLEGRRRVPTETIDNFTNLNKGRFGKQHPKWTENKKRPFYGAIRLLHEYKIWRLDIFDKDNYTCQSCKIRGGNLEAHHSPKRFIDIIKSNKLVTIEDAILCKELWKASGKTLCKKCHVAAHTIK